LPACRQVALPFFFLALIRFSKSTPIRSQMAIIEAVAA